MRIQQCILSPKPLIPDLGAGLGGGLRARLLRLLLQLDGGHLARQAVEVLFRLGQEMGDSGKALPRRLQAAALLQQHLLVRLVVVHLRTG